MSLATIPPMQAVGPQDTAELLVDCKNDAQLCSGVNCAENCKEELCSCCCGDNLNGGTKYSRAWFGKLVKYAVKYGITEESEEAEKHTGTMGATKAATQVVTKVGLKSLAKNVLATSAFTEGAFWAYDVYSAYDKMQQDISNSQEGSDKATTEFKKKVVEHTMSSASAVGATTVGAVIGTMIFPGLGTCVGVVVGNILGGYAGSQAGEAVGKAMFDSDK